MFDSLSPLEFFSQSTCCTFLESLRVEESKLHRFQFFLGDFGVFFGLERGSSAKLMGANFSENFKNDLSRNHEKMHKERNDYRSSNENTAIMK